LGQAQPQQQRTSSEGASMIGYAESESLVHECLTLVEAGAWEQARQAIEECLLVRCQNTKIKDAIELCQFAVSALRTAQVAKAAKFAADAKKRFMM
jgi:hypothetical protein